MAGRLRSRALMFLASALWGAFILVVLVSRGGVTAPVRPRPEPVVLTPAQQARVLAARGDYLGAWKLYYQALSVAPEDVSLWYGLGVTLSHLDMRRETEEAFQRVVRWGRADSEEVGLARLWLVRAGALAPAAQFPTASTSAPPSRSADAEGATLRGSTSWEMFQPDWPPLKVQIVLEGLDGAAGGKRFETRVPLGQAYRFARLPAGSYRLVGGVAARRLWDLTFTVEDGNEVVLDLGKLNSRNPGASLYL